MSQPLQGKFRIKTRATEIECTPNDGGSIEQRHFVALELFCPVSYKIKMEIEQNNTGARVYRFILISIWLNSNPTR